MKPGSKSEEQDNVRLQKYLAECGIASRRAAEELIQGGKVTVNGKTVTKLGTKIDPRVDRVQVGKRALVPPPKGVILFNKPRGVVTTLNDPEGRPTISDYLTKRYRSYYPVGRLDWDSSGLVVLTNDGELADRLLHPRYGMERVYQVRVEGRVTEATMQRLVQGIRLQDGPARADVKFLEGDNDSSWLELRLTEGRNRIIRRMMEAIGHPVSKLRRIAHGPFRLGSLQPGQIRKLTEREYEQVRRAALGGKVYARLNRDERSVRNETRSRVRIKKVPHHHVEPEQERHRPHRPPRTDRRREYPDAPRSHQRARGPEAETFSTKGELRETRPPRSDRQRQAPEGQRPYGRGRGPERDTFSRGREPREQARPPRTDRHREAPDTPRPHHRARRPEAETFSTRGELRQQAHRGRAARGEQRSFAESVEERRPPRPQHRTPSRGGRPSARPSDAPQRPPFQRNDRPRAPRAQKPRGR